MKIERTHFHFGVFYPQSDVSKIDVESSFPNTSSALRKTKNVEKNSFETNSKFLLLRWISCWDSSQWAYLTQLTIFVRFFRMASSYSLRFFIRYSANSSGSLIFCRGGGATYSNCFSLASRNNCSAVIWILKKKISKSKWIEIRRSTYGAGILFLT